jgi:antitoxin ParD1/3/4
MVSKVQKISVAMPKEMIDHIRAAVDSGDYASTSEVFREAVREWRDARRPFPPNYPYARNMDDLRRMAQEGIDAADRGEVKPAEEVFDRLEAKYRAMLPKQRKARKR